MSGQVAISLEQKLIHDVQKQNFVLLDLQDLRAIHFNFYSSFLMLVGFSSKIFFFKY